MSKQPILPESVSALDLPLVRPGEAEVNQDYFFANSLDMLCVAGFDGFFKRLNPTWTTTLGWTIEELQERAFLEFVHPDDRAATVSEMEELIRGGRTIVFENRYRCKDGSYKWLEWNATSRRDRQRIYAIARDVTSRKALEMAIVESGDREKERLGRELHDGLCQNLAGIVALSATLSRSLAADSEPADVAREISRLLNETIDGARDMARGLNPVNLEQIGIAAALETLAANVAALFSTDCKFRCHQRFPKLAPKGEFHLYRIAQEAVNNAITHGRCSHIEISLGFRGAEGLLSIRDDGIGLPENPEKGTGTGVYTMGYRARLIGGVLLVQRHAEQGTIVTVTFSLPDDVGSC